MYARIARVNCVILPTQDLPIIIVWKSVVWRVAFLDIWANFLCALFNCGTRSHLCTKMLHRRHLSVRDMERISGMLQAGATQRCAAAQFGVTQYVVRRIWQCFLDTGRVKERPKSGR